MAKWNITLEIESETDPANWNWDNSIVIDEPVEVIESVKL